jgi:hypothetical protein
MPDGIRHKTNKRRAQMQKKNYCLFWALTIKGDDTNTLICGLPLFARKMSSHGRSGHQVPFKKHRTEYRFEAVLMNAKNNSIWRSASTEYARFTMDLTGLVSIFEWFIFLVSSLPCSSGELVYTFKTTNRSYGNLRLTGPFWNLSETTFE